MLTVGSLFSGIGGFDEGFRRAGIRTLWQVELDEACRRVLNRRFPEAEHSPDVERIHGQQRQQPSVRRELNVGTQDRLRAGNSERSGGRDGRIIRGVASDLLPNVDVVCGGFPCQDLSVAGKRAGLAGERSGLWFQFHRLLAELAPRWVVIENVPGLLSSNGGRDMAVILRGLAELGYGWAYRVLDAQYFGVAQRRRRVFIVGCLGDGAAAAQVLFESESCDGDSPPSRAPREGLAGTLGGGSGERGWAPDTERMTFIPEVTGTLTNHAAGSYNGRDAERDMFVAATLSSGGHPNSNDGHHEPKVWQGMAVRRLTPTECERLQGFPDGWTEGESDSARYRMLGNAVCVPVAEWIARRIVNVG